MPHIGAVIRGLRTDQGYSQDELARLAGVQQSYISKLEKNPNINPSMRVLAGIAQALGVTPDYIIQQASSDTVTDKDIDELIALYRQLPRDMRTVARALIRALLRSTPAQGIAEDREEYNTNNNH